MAEDNIIPLAEDIFHGRADKKRPHKSEVFSKK